MNEDIEILKDKLKKKLENYELDKKIGQLSVDSIYSLFPNESKTLLDYIEQLKEENERLQEQKDFWRKEFVGKKEQLDKYKEVAEEVREYITIYRSYANINGRDYLKDRDEIGELDTEQVDKVLQILDKAKGEINNGE